MMGNGMMYGPYGGGIFFPFLFWTVIVIGVILLIVWVVRQTGKRAGSHSEETALDDLKSVMPGEKS